MAIASSNARPSVSITNNNLLTTLPNDGSQPITENIDGAVEKPQALDIPDGGLNAWMQVLGAHFLFFNSWGIVNTYGAFQTYYQQELFQSRTSSDMSWIGTFQGFLLIVVGVISGPFYDRGYFRTLVVSGTLLVVFGMMMTSLVGEYYQAFLAQGLVVGLGAGFLFVPSLAIVATYFSTKRALATGIASAGGSIGAVLYPIVFRRLQSRIGFSWAVRVIAFIVLATLLVSVSIMKTRLKPGRSRALLEPTAFKEIPFTLFTAGLFLTFIGLYIPFFYISAYGERMIFTSLDFSFDLLAIMNAGSVFGRIIPNLLADRFGSLNVLVPCALITAILAFVWIRITTVAGIVLFSLLYGFFSGAILSLLATVVATLSPDPRFFGTRMGMSFSFSGLGFLIGNPIAGAVLNIPAGRFSGAQIFSGVMVLVGTALFLVARLLKARSDKAWKC